MTIVIAPDKFKHSLTAGEVCKAIAEGLRTINPFWKIISVPLADGGEGTGDLLANFSDGKNINLKVLDPLFREIDSGYSISGDGKIAFIEMAQASGLKWLKSSEKNPLNTTTFGTGQLLVSAMEAGVERIVLGIGGSATNDAGMGMAEALGYTFLSAEKKKLKPIGKNLGKIYSIDISGVHPRLEKVNFTVLCDVLNPLYGKNGAAYIYGPQKGADLPAIEILDEGLRHFDQLVKDTFRTDSNFPGAGAAGGLGAGAKVFLNAEMINGFDFITNLTGLEDKIKEADLVITGEGKLDEQSFSGKVVSGVAKMATRFGKPCIALVGICTLNDQQLKQLGIKKVLFLVDEKTSEIDAIQNAHSLLKDRVIGEFSEYS